MLSCLFWLVVWSKAIQVTFHHFKPQIQTWLVGQFRSETSKGLVSVRMLKLYHMLIWVIAFDPCRGKVALQSTALLYTCLLSINNWQFQKRHISRFAYKGSKLGHRTRLGRKAAFIIDGPHDRNENEALDADSDDATPTAPTKKANRKQQLRISLTQGEDTEL